MYLFFSVGQLRMLVTIKSRLSKKHQPRNEMNCFYRYCDQSKLHLVPFISNGAKSHLVQPLRRFPRTRRPANDDPPAMLCFLLVGPHARRPWWYNIFIIINHNSKMAQVPTIHGGEGNGCRRTHTRAHIRTHTHTQSNHTPLLVQKC